MIDENKYVLDLVHHLLPNWLILNNFFNFHNICEPNEKSPSHTLLNPFPSSLEKSTVFSFIFPARLDSVWFYFDKKILIDILLAMLSHWHLKYVKCFSTWISPFRKSWMNTRKICLFENHYAKKSKVNLVRLKSIHDM